MTTAPASLSEARGTAVTEIANGSKGGSTFNAGALPTLASEKVALFIPPAEARKRRKAIITTQRNGISQTAGSSEDDPDVSEVFRSDATTDVDVAVGLSLKVPLVVEAAVAAAAAVASNHAAVQEEKSAIAAAAAVEPPSPSAPTTAKGRKHKASVDEDHSDDNDEDEEEGASQSDSSRNKNGRSRKSKKTQVRYDPAIPMDKEQLAAWRREARRVRNRESAAASRQKIRGRISELEDEVHDWKSKYETAMERLKQMQQGKASKNTTANLDTSVAAAPKTTTRTTSTTEGV